MSARPGPFSPKGTTTWWSTELETAFCAEVVALTYEAAGLLFGGRRPNWYDPGRFSPGDDLEPASGARLGREIAVEVPTSTVSREL